MDETGRINPTLEGSGLREVTVVQDDNLWNLAHEYGYDFQEVLALNSEHLIDPSLIFAGDTIYLPEVVNAPEPVDPASEAESVSDAAESVSDAAESVSPDGQSAESVSRTVTAARRA